MENVDQAFDMGSIVRVVVKRRWVIIGVFLFIFGLRMIASYREVPVYEATATITIQKENANIVTLQDIFNPDTFSGEYYQTQYKILESQTMAKKVLARLRANKTDTVLLKGKTKAASGGGAERKRCRRRFFSPHYTGRFKSAS